MDFPVQILVDILLRLPEESIITWKCVCKTWHDLISDPEVAKLLQGKENTTLLIQDIDWYLIEPKDDLKYRGCESTSETLISNQSSQYAMPKLGSTISKMIPRFLGSRVMGSTACGLGFSSKFNQYKLITTYDVVIIEAGIHTLGIGTWKSVGSAPFSAFALDFPTYLNGVLHWLFVDKYSRSWIISFDLDYEQFDYHSVPTPSPYYLRLTIGVLGGSL
ncbi:F-box domain containing protein [Parasponia andersonii]|uniref:F-box domain containing protein n=1 Tax=Parasponia andersonii TaxID=3476 RepID=A0A2P5ANY4_PARAD|nr:F-box domain containing protein [Parasponia andersonii]